MTWFDGSCRVSVRSSENRFYSLEVHPAIAQSAELCSSESKESNASHLSVIASHLNVIASLLNLDATVVFICLHFCCLLSTFYSAEAVLGTTEAVSSELLAEAV